MTILQPDTQLCISGNIYAEYDEVIRRPRLGRSAREIEGTLRTVRERGFWVKPVETVDVCPDPDDDIFLECAQASDAHYLITGNVRDFPDTWGATQIVTARQFLDAVV